MKKAPIPPNEKARLDATRLLGILDTKPEPRFDAITKRVAEHFNAPIAMISIIDEKREWYKSCQGTAVKEGGRDVSFCGHAIASNQAIFVVEDTLKDERFADNPQVVKPPHIRFYAGAALREYGSLLPVGVLCIKDVQPRTFTEKDVGDLIAFAKEAEVELNNPPKV